jgi:hypothetical protein
LTPAAIDIFRFNVGIEHLGPLAGHLGPSLVIVVLGGQKRAAFAAIDTAKRRHDIHFLLLSLGQRAPQKQGRAVHGAMGFYIGIFGAIPEKAFPLKDIHSESGRRKGIPIISATISRNKEITVAPAGCF